MPRRPLITAIVYKQTGSMHGVLIYTFLVTFIPYLLLRKYLDIDEGRMQCRSLRTMVWVKRMRLAKGLGRRQKKKKKKKNAKVDPNASSVTSDVTSSQAGGVSSTGMTELTPDLSSASSISTESE